MSLRNGFSHFFQRAFLSADPCVKWTYFWNTQNVIVRAKSVEKFVFNIVFHLSTTLALEFFWPKSFLTHRLNRIGTKTFQKMPKVGFFTNKCLYDNFLLVMAETFALASVNGKEKKSAKFQTCYIYWVSYSFIESTRALS